MMRTVFAIAVCALMTGAAFAHHGWGSYDAAKPVTAVGPILTSEFENPHARITVRASDKTWTVILAPTSRMISRGATTPSTVEKNEMRAERITVNCKTYEMR
jgi:hypothetical protein